MIKIDWAAFGLVFAAALIAALIIVTLFALALRLLATGEDVDHRTTIATTGAGICIIACAAVVIYGIYLVIPLFHSK